MSSIPLISTQLVPPHVKNCIRRVRLRTLGLSILSHHVTTVIAPAGYGKSVWISSLLEEPGWPPTAWLSLDRHDSESSTLLFHLVHSLKLILPGYGKDSLRTLNSLQDVGRDWLIAVSSLIEEIPKHSEIVLVLDDFHLIDNNRIVCKIVEHLVHWLPAGVHLVLISRNSLPLNLSRELVSGELLEIQSNLLLFSADESRQMLLRLGLNMGNDELAIIDNLVEGWAVGLRLLGMYLRRTNTDLKQALAVLEHNYPDLFAYLSNELFDYLPDNLQSFLMDASLLPYLQPDLCDAALQCTDSAAKISQLYSFGILSLLDQTEGGKAWRLHHLISEFLKEKLLQARAADDIAAVRQRAAAFFESIGEIDRALEQVTACAGWADAVSLIHAHGDKYFLESGRLDALFSWINRLPEDYVACDHRLLYLKGMSILHVDWEAALELLANSVDLAEQDGDTRGQIRSLMAMLAAYTLANDAKKLQETANRIPIAASLVKDAWTRGVVLVAGLMHAVSEDQLKLGVWLSRLAGRSKLDPEWRMYYLFSSAIIQYRLGNMVQAKKVVEEALALPIVRDSDRWTGTAYEILSGIYCDTGDYKRTIELSQELLRLGHKYNITHQIAYGHRRQGRVHQRQGRVSEALREFELSRSAALEANNVLMVNSADLDIILVRSIAGENPTSLLEEIHGVQNNILANPGQGYQDYALSLAGVIAREAGELALSQQWLEESAARSSGKGAKQLLTGTLLHLAKLHLLKGEERQADSSLRRALGIAAAAELDVFWDWHPETVYSMCRLALLKNIQPKWAAHILRRWFPQRMVHEAVTFLVHPDENVRYCVTELLQDMTRKTGKPIVHVNCLGDFRVFVNGIEVSKLNWKTKKAESLFKFLIIHRHPHLKEVIIEQLWPESDPKLGDASLRMALTHLRQALDPTDSATESVILRRGMIYLNLDIEIHTDYELFTERARSALEQVNAENPATLELFEQAADLCRGDFLPDNLYDDWAAGMRTSLRELYLQLLLKQLEFYLKLGRQVPAIQTGRRYLALEPADESLTRTTMELLWRNGQKQQALSVYQELAAVLAKDYDLIPSHETNKLYNEIRGS